MRNHSTGIRHWADELQKRRIPAVFGIEESQLSQHPGLIRELRDKGFDFECSHPEPFWNESYQSQYEIITRFKSKFEAMLNKPMCAFSSKYSAYNEDTLKIAEKLGIRYILARGNSGLKAEVYKPAEYNVILISASSIPANKGGGMLVDGSVWSTGGNPESLKDILFNLKEDRITLTAQAQLSGVKLFWWNAYQAFLDANIVDWVKLDEFAANPITLPYSDIPGTTEIGYLKPQPKISMDQEVDFPFDK
jgi:peptidoglycan/xylan/chitin deacetylase (PgdA/CDA1 family)